MSAATATGIIMYRMIKYHYFLIDFCYYANLACFVHILGAPTSGRLFRSVFAYSNGPILWAIPLWRNSLVFHSHDKVQSVFIHTAPAILTWCTRWYGQGDLTWSWWGLGDATGWLFAVREGDHGQAVAPGLMYADVAAVHYPGLAAHPDHAVANAHFERDARTGAVENYGGMLSFELANAERALACVRACRLFARATSQYTGHAGPLLSRAPLTPIMNSGFLAHHPFLAHSAHSAHSSRHASFGSAAFRSETASGGMPSSGATAKRRSEAWCRKPPC